MMRRIVLGSCRKFCPRFFVGLTPSRSANSRISAGPSSFSTTAQRTWLCLWITPEEDRIWSRKGDMTVTYPIAGSFSIGAGAPFTVDDLFALPDNGNRYEIFDGSLVMSPPPATGHIHVTILMRQLLEEAVPEDCYVVSEGLGIYPTERDYYIPDL